jgi:ribosome biogenesis GTPase / thiamine phosphate phosphatase
MDLHVLGWNAHWRDLFEPYVSQSLLPGRVVVEHRGAYRIEMDRGERSGTLAGRLRYQAGRRADLPAVGDFVAVRLPEAGTGDGPAVIEAVLPRRTAFVRRAAGARPDDQVIAANIDTVFVMTGLDHDFNVRRIERYLAAVWESGANPVVLLNKADVCADVGKKIDELRAVVIGVDVLVVSALTAEGVDTLAAYWREGTTVGFVGSSGVGKSTLLNRLLGRDVQATGGVRAHDSRGRHTTTHRELFVLPYGGLVIDTPGMREFTLSDADEGVDAVFGDIDALAARCRFADCAHRGEPGCAVHDAVERGELAADRLAAFHKLLNELRYEESRGDRVAAAERKRQGRIGAKAIRRMKRDAES